MKKLVIAPHPDDEILGCGGYLLKSKINGDLISWLIITGLHEKDGWPIHKIKSRKEEIDKVRKKLNISQKNLYNLNLPTTKLDQYPISKLIQLISEVFESFQPEEVLLPHPGDIHSDHRIVFEASLSATKWFRYPFIKRILTYETISETDFAADPRYLAFKPNIFVDISDQLKDKLNTIQIYASEVGSFPFPRSIESISSQAKVRGSQAGFKAAEAFCLIKEILN
tara:strand:- start:1364 stop:2038 length:675 start_codon:yes stop_codon:yes gene_type:complete